MKNKILTFIIGLLIGAIITTTVFFIYLKVNKNDNTSANNQTHQMGMPGDMKDMTPPDMQDGENESTDGSTTEKRTRPTKQNGENGSDESSRPTPPDMQNGENQKPSEESQQAENNA